MKNISNKMESWVKMKHYITKILLIIFLCFSLFVYNAFFSNNSIFAQNEDNNNTNNNEENTTE